MAQGLVQQQQQPQQAFCNQSVRCCIRTLLIGIMQLQTAGNVAATACLGASCPFHVADGWLQVAGCRLLVASCQCAAPRAVALIMCALAKI